MMKRLMTAALALAMLMSTAAYAADAGDHPVEVTATFVDGIDASPIVYSVDITWEDLDFTYYEASAPTWDPVNHQYNGDSREAGWDANDAASVAIVNHSNTDILASFSYTANTGFETAGMSFASEGVYIATAEDGSEKTASNTVTPTGTLPEGTDGAVIGSITINIAKCPSVSKDTAYGFVTEFTSLNMGYSNAYKVVENQGDIDELTGGQKYVWKADLTEFNQNYMQAFDQYVQAVPSQTLTAQQQTELNQKYYAIKAEWANFLAAKTYTKA